MPYPLATPHTCLKVYVFYPVCQDGHGPTEVLRFERVFLHLTSGHHTEIDRISLPCYDVNTDCVSDTFAVGFRRYGQHT